LRIHERLVEKKPGGPELEPRLFGEETKNERLQLPTFSCEETKPFYFPQSKPPLPARDAIEEEASLRVIHLTRSSGERNLGGGDRRGKRGLRLVKNAKTFSSGGP